MTHSASLLGITTHSELTGFSPSPTVLTAEPGHGPGHGLQIPGGNFLLTADFYRVGGDLLLVGKDGHEVVVRDYFSSHTPPDLISGTGGVIHPDLAARLAGAIAPGQWAEDGAPQTQLHAIGEIQKLSGTVKVHHIDGRVETLQQGATVFQGDVLETTGDGSVGIVFADRSTFSLGKNGRMVMDELVYDPQAHTGHSSLSVVQGTFSFVSGQIAKSAPDAMSVKTPVMTIGIRGTTVAGTAAAEGSQNTVALLSDDDGGVGQIVITTQTGSQVMTIPNQAVQISSAFQAPPPLVILRPDQLHQMMPDLSNVQDHRPPPPPSDPHINTGATSGNSTATAATQSTPTTTTPSTATAAEAAAAAHATGGVLNIPDATVLDATRGQTQDAVHAVTSGTLLTHNVDPLVQPETQSQTQRASNETANNASAASASVDTTATTVTTAAITPPTTATTTPTTTTTTTTLNNAPTTTIDAVHTLLGHTGADILTGGSGTNVFIGHGGSDTYILGSSTNILMMDNNPHDEIIIDSSGSGVHNIINAAGLARDGFAGFSENSSGDLVVHFNDAGGGGTTTFKDYYGSDTNVLSVIGGHGSEVMTFLKDDTGASSATVIYGTSPSTMNEIIGDGGKDLILAHGDNMVVLASSGIVSSHSGGNLEVVVQGFGDIIVANPNVHNAAFFNSMTSAQSMTFDLTGRTVHDLTIDGAALTAANNGNALFTTGPETASTASGATTYMYGIDSVYGTDNGDTFIGGMLYSGTAYSQEFYAGNGTNTVIDIGYTANLALDGHYNNLSLSNAPVTVSYAESTGGITAYLGINSSQNIEAHSYYVNKTGFVVHGLITDVLYEVWDVQGSAHDDVFNNAASHRAVFLSSQGNDSYTGNGSTAGTEVSYEDSGAAVLINLSGSTQNGLASGLAVHDGGFTDSLNSVEEVRLAADYSSKLYGDGMVVLDMSSTEFNGMTANLSTGKAYGWEAGVTESFQNIGGLMDTVGGSDFIVTSTDIETKRVWGNAANSTLDLTALGGSIHLSDSVNGVVHSGTAFLIGTDHTTELVYSGITELDTNIPTVPLVITGATLDFSSATAGVTATLSDYGSANSGTATSANGAISRFANIEVVVGSSHNDLLIGSPNASSTLIGGGGSDTLIGGSNDDVLILSSGTAVIDGGDGQNLLSLQNAASGITADMANSYVTGAVSATFQNIEVVVGSSHNDLLTGSPNASSTLYGGGGADTLVGGSSDDILVLNGSHGGTIIGGDGNDTMSGANGDDVFIVSSGTAVIDGGDGKDLLSMHDAGWGVTVDLADGSVTGAVSATFQNIEIIKGSGTDDLFHSHQTGTTFIGGGGDDTVTVTDSVTVDMSAGKVWSTNVGTDTLIDIDAVSSGAGVAADYIVTSASLAVTSILASDADSTLDLSHLANGVTAVLANQSVNGSNLGEALLMSSTGTAVLSYGVQTILGNYSVGIGSTDYGNGSGFDLTTACLVDSPATDIQVNLSTRLASYNGTSFYLVGDMPSAEETIHFYLSDAVSSLTLKGNLEQLSNVDAYVYQYGSTTDVPTIALEVTSGTDVLDSLFTHFANTKVGQMAVQFDHQSTIVLGKDAAYANLEWVDFQVGSGNSIDASYDTHALTIHVNGTHNVVTGNSYMNDTLDLTGGVLTNIFTDTVSNIATLRADDVNALDMAGFITTLSSDGISGIDFSHNASDLTITANLGDLAGMTLAGGSGENRLFVSDTTIDDSEFYGFGGFPTLIATNVEIIALDFASESAGITNLDLTHDSYAGPLNIEAFYGVTVTLSESQFLQAANISGNIYNTSDLAHLVVTNVTTGVHDTAFDSSRFSGVGSILFEGSGSTTAELGINAGTSSLEWVGFQYADGNTVDASQDTHALTIHLNGSNNVVTGNSLANDTLDMTDGALANLLTDSVSHIKTLRSDSVSVGDLTSVVTTAISDGIQTLDFSHDTLAMTVTANLGDLIYIVGTDTDQLTMIGSSSNKNLLVATDATIADSLFGAIHGFETLSASQASAITLGSAANSEGITNLDLSQDANLSSLDTTADGHDITVALTRNQLLNSGISLLGHDNNGHGLTHLVITDGSLGVGDGTFAAARFSGVGSMDFETSANVTLGSNAAESDLHTISLNSTGLSTIDTTADANLSLVMDASGYLNYQGYNGSNTDALHTVMLRYDHLAGDSVDAGVGHNFLDVYVNANTTNTGINVISEGNLQGPNLVNFETMGLLVEGYDMVTATLDSSLTYTTVILDLQHQYAGAYFDTSDFDRNLVVYTAGAGNLNGASLPAEYITLGNSANSSIIGATGNNAIITLNTSLDNCTFTKTGTGTVSLSDGGADGNVTMSGVHMIKLSEGAFAISAADEYNVSLSVDSEAGITGLLVGEHNLSVMNLSAMYANVITLDVDHTTAWIYRFAYGDGLQNGLDTFVLQGNQGEHTFTLSVGYDPGGWDNIATETVTGDLTLHDGSHVDIETTFQGGVLTADQLADGGSGHFTAGGDLNLYAMTSDTPVDSGVAHIMTMTKDDGAFAHITGLDAYASSGTVLELTYYQGSIDLTSHVATLATTPLTEGTGCDNASTFGADFMVGNGSGGQTLSGGGGADEILAVGNNNEVIVGDNSFKYLDGGGSGSELEFAFSHSGTVNLTGSGVLAPADATSGTHRSDSVEHFDMLDLTNSHGSTLVLNEAAVYSIANTGTNALLENNATTKSNALIIGGKAGDAVVMDSSSYWTEDRGVTNLTVNGHTDSYQVYHSNNNGHNETVYVDSHVSVSGQIHLDMP